jgi:hypothetical protein
VCGRTAHFATDFTPADRPEVKLINHSDDSRRMTPKKIVHIHMFGLIFHAKHVRTRLNISR